MIKVNKRRNLAQVLTCGTAMVMVTMLAAPVAMAQDAAPTAQTNDDAVIVIGTRKSQQTAIDRKKKAKTATDSIIAEDVGVFPDRNIGEAISRIAGVALDRGDFNEGSSVTLRGNSSSQTNVEIDGLGVQTNTIAGGLSFGSDGRGKSFQEFPADLIKSVDVVKGTTSAMTEGGLGGSILIQSRTGLDFKKPYLSFRYAYTKNSLSNDWTPDFNLIASRKFFNNRLGVLLNFTQTRVQNDQSNIQPQTSANQGLARLVDFDGSAEKSFAYNPDTVSKTDPAATTVFANSSPFADGTTKTPLSLVTRSAAAATKADCYTAFPLLTGDNAASLQRGQELVTCLNQWNDYTPSLIRYVARRDDEQRRTIDLRFDYKVNDDLTVYAKFNTNKREIDNHQLTYTLGNLSVNPVSVSTPTYNGRGYVDTTTSPATRSAIAGSGYYLYPGISLGSAPPTSLTVVANRVVNGLVANVDPTSVVVDSKHHVTKFSISDGNVNTDQIHNTNDFNSTYLSAGGTYQHGNLKAEFIVGDATSEYTRYDRRTNFSYTYGPATLELVPTSGLWTYTTPPTVDFTNPNLYTIVRAPTGGQTAVLRTATANNGFALRDVPGYTQAQMPWVSGNIGMQWSPRANETHDQTGKFDVYYDVEERLPFITKFQSGVQYRNQEQQGWGGGGATISAQDLRGGANGTAGYIGPVATPSALQRGSVRACDDTRYGLTGTAAPAGANPCDYGYVRNNSISQDWGVMTLTPGDLSSIIGQSFEPAWYQFFNGVPDRGNLFNGWSQINVDKFYELVSAASQNPKYAAGGDPLKSYNFDCLKVCKGSDGKMYAQPKSTSSEKTTAYYFMTEFEQDLPLGTRFDGNIGFRIVQTDVHGTGFFTLNSIRKTSAFNPATPAAAAGITTLTATSNVSFDGKSTDWLPSFNGNIWLIDNKLVARYFYGRMVSRPPINQLLPQGNCTFDERIDTASGADYGCGTVGNPSLKPFRSKNMNWSLEWYPNKDTQFSLATFRNKVTSGSTIVSGANGAVLSGTGLVDPATGATVDGVDFNYATFVNGPGQIRRGIEFATKTAFTFLPWYFKYTGFDGNYAKLESSDSIQLRDLISGTALPPTNESSYYYNASLWYDDGATNVRVAMQARDKFFRGIAPEGNANTINNYPADGVVARPIPYNIGSPNFQGATKYIDFKMSHKFKAGVEYFFEAKNVLKEVTQRDQDMYNTYADGTPVVLDFGYPGYRITTGIIIRR